MPRFRSQMKGAANQCGMTRMQQPGEEKLLILNQKSSSSYRTDISVVNLPQEKIDRFFGFWASQNVKLIRSTCFRVLKSCFEINSVVAKTERLALSEIWSSVFPCSKGSNMITPFSQSAWKIWIKFEVPDTVFLQFTFFLNQEFWKCGFWSRDWNA